MQQNGNLLFADQQCRRLSHQKPTWITSRNTWEFKHKKALAAEESDEKTEWLFGLSLKIYSEIDHD